MRPTERMNMPNMYPVAFDCTHPIVHGKMKSRHVVTVLRNDPIGRTISVMFPNGDKAYLRVGAKLIKPERYDTLYLETNPRVITSSRTGGVDITPMFSPLDILAKRIEKNPDTVNQEAVITHGSVVGKRDNIVTLRSLEAGASGRLISFKLNTMNHGWKERELIQITVGMKEPTGKAKRITSTQLRR